MSMRKKIRGLTPEQIKSLPKGTHFFYMHCCFITSFETQPLSLSFTEDLEIPATLSDFESAIKKIQSSVSQSDLKRYKDWMDEFGSV